MSIISEKSPKHCANKQRIIFHKKIIIYLSTLSLTILSLTLLVWFILHPINPRFSLKQADIKQLNITAPSSIHLTIQSTNPSNKLGIYYDQILLHASYNGQIITPRTPIPPFYQHHGETSILSASLVGNQQPLDPYQLVQHHHYTGKLELDFKVTARLRWKVGNWVLRRYGFDVNFMTVLSCGHKVVPPSKQGTVCSTSV